MRFKLAAVEFAMFLIASISRSRKAILAGKSGSSTPRWLKTAFGCTLLEAVRDDVSGYCRGELALPMLLGCRDGSEDVKSVMLPRPLLRSRDGGYGVAAADD